MEVIINWLRVVGSMEASLLFIGAVLLFACTMQGITGFGQSLIAVPLLIVILSPRSVAPLMLLSGTLLNLLLAVEARKHVRPGRFWLIVIGGIAGVPIGMLGLLFFSSSLIRLMVGPLILAFSVLLLLGYTVRVHNEKAALLPVGFVSGILNGSVTMSGPPVILFFTNQELGKEVFRANLIVYFLILNLFTIPLFFYGGLFSSKIIQTFLIMVPIIVIASALGIYLSSKLPKGLFRKAVLVIVMGAGISSILSGLEII